MNRSSGPSKPNSASVIGRDLIVSGQLFLVGLMITATCPIHAQTTISLDQKLIADSSRAFDTLGRAVAVEGETIVVGAPAHDTDGDNQRGAAYVFVAPPGGWPEAEPLSNEVAKLIASDGTAQDNLGFKVAIAGDLVAVAARRRDTAAGNSVGAVYLFEKPAAGWPGRFSEPVTENAILLASDGAFEDFLGEQLEIAGDTIVVSAPGKDDNGFDDDGGSTSEGAVYVFNRPAGGWSGTINESAKLVGRFSGNFATVGHSLAVDDGFIVAGRGPFTANRSSSIAYLFVRPFGGWSGLITESARLIPSELETSFGFDGASIEDDVIAIAAPGSSVSGIAGHGRVYLFQRPVGGWIDGSGVLTSNAILSESSGLFAARFGAPVQIHEDRIVVGRSHTGGASDDDIGSVYIFDRPASGWSGMHTETSVVIPADGDTRDFFGVALDYDGDTLVVGATQGDRNTRSTDSGAAYVADSSLLDAPMFSDGFESPQ